MTGSTRPVATGRPGADAWLVDAHDALLLDLDGVVYVGPAPVRHAVEVLAEVRRRGVVTAYVTNNAARPPAVVADHLRSFGLVVADHDIVTSAQAGAREVASLVAVGSRVLCVGGPGVADALRARGLEPVSSADDAPVAVLMGYGPEVGWRDLAEASYAVGAGALFVATNTDLSIPTDRGLAPGNGTLVAAVTAATGRSPLVAGKPYAPLIEESVERVGSTRPLVVGDRLDTDVEAGYRSHIDTFLVLTGVTGVDELLSARFNRRPTFVAADLRGLLRPAEDLRILRDDSSGSRDRPGDRLGPLRRACRRSWEAADAGEAAGVTAEEVVALRSDVAAALRA